MSRLDYCKHELVDDCYDWKNDNCHKCNIFKAYCEGARRARASIVRCKECKKYISTRNECTFHNVMIVYPEFYCRSGERRG